MCVNIYIICSYILYKNIIELPTELVQDSEAWTLLSKYLFQDFLKKWRVFPLFSI